MHCEVLHKGIHEDNLLLVSMMLDQKDININIKDKDGRTALHVAATDNNHLMAQLLLQHGADTGAVSGSGKTPLDCARDDEMVLLLGQYMAKHGQYKLIREKIKHIESKNRKQKKFETENRSFLSPAGFLKTRAKKAILDAGAGDCDSMRSSLSDISSICDSGFVESSAESSECLAFEHCPAKRTTPVQRRETNPITQQELTAIKARRFRNLGETRDASANSNIVRKTRRQTLSTRVELIQSRKKPSKQVKQVSFTTDVLLDIAITNDEFEQACHLIKSKRVDINQAFPNGLTPLHRAAIEGSDDCLQLLLDQGAKVDVQDEYGWTALHDAVYHGNITCVAALLKAGANVSLLTNDMYSILELANKEEVLLAVGRALVLYELGHINDIGDDININITERESCV